MTSIPLPPPEDEDDDFYDSKSEASQIKIRIVTKYFGFWTKIMLPIAARTRSKSLAYMDFYCGPGVYKDGAPSTPVLILSEVLNNEQLREVLVTHFNDKDPEHTKALEENLAQIPNIENLRHAPVITTGEIDRGFEEQFANVALVPTFTFIDPFGYKGVTLKFLQAMLKDWGCDLILFFSYNRINAALTNDKVEDHIIALFGGKDCVETLVKALERKKPHEREAMILESFSGALKDMGFRYVLPFSFMQEKRKRTSHYLIFVCKDKLGYKVMKDIMAAESSEYEQGVASFGYVPALSEEQTPLLFELSRPLDELGQRLLTIFAGQTLTTEDVYEKHNVDTPFTLKNYKDALSRLLDEGKIATDRKPARAGTFANTIRVTFPPKD